MIRQQNMKKMSQTSLYFVRTNKYTSPYIYLFHLTNLTKYNGTFYSMQINYCIYVLHNNWFITEHLSHGVCTLWVSSAVMLTTKEMKIYLVYLMWDKFPGWFIFWILHLSSCFIATLTAASVFTWPFLVGSCVMLVYLHYWIMMFQKYLYIQILLSFNFSGLLHPND